MSAVARISDRVNPLVIKELRQGVRSRVLWSAFALLLVACLGIALTAYLAHLSGAMRLDGRGYFVAFFSCTCAVYLFVIPSMAYQSLLREQEGETWPLLIMTGLGARRILLGKVSSALVLAGLYSSVILPFLLFAYYLNGIELRTILLLTVAASGLMIFLTFSFVCWATFGNHRVVRGLLRGVMLFSSLGVASTVVMVSSKIIDRGRLWDRETLTTVAVLLWFMSSFGYLFFEVAVARLSMEGEDFSRGPRRALLFQILGSCAVVAYLWWHDRSWETPFFFQMGTCVFLALAGIHIATDRDGLSRSLGRDLRGWNLLMPGAARGFRFFLLLLGAATAGAATLVAMSPYSGDRQRGFQALFAGCGYAAGYVASGLLLGHFVRVGTLTVHVRSRIAFGILVLLGVLPPIILDVVVPPLSPWPGLLSPIGGLLHVAEGDYKGNTRLAVALVVGGALILCIAANSVLAGRDAKARPAAAVVPSGG